MIEEEAEITEERVYAIPLSNLFLRDVGETEEAVRRERLEYHIKSGDYFNMVATVIGFLEESLKQHCAEDPALEAQEIAIAQNLRKDLMHMNENYRIEPKE